MINLLAGALYALVLWAGLARLKELTKAQIEDELQAFLKHDTESQ
nr:hypothetical protein [Rhodococcus sp. (in: high G+C Gram-positive bacteria)]